MSFGTWRGPHLHLVGGLAYDEDKVATLSSRGREVFAFHNLLGRQSDDDADLMRLFLSKLLRHLSKLSSKSVEVDGLWVAADDRARLSKVQGAMTLIKVHDPRRYARMVSDLEGIWATLLTGPLGQFSYDDYICELDDRFVVSASSERIASVIVHEATHARLWRRGVRYREDIRSRVEAVCTRQQQVFETRLPVPGMNANELVAYLDLPAATWSDEAMRRDDLRGTLDALRHIKVPDWLILYVFKRRRALSQRQRRAGR